ncbi:hypothetical protein BGW42_002859 [Actinomortierella wolfii]|nr:hypothetical protein BGW42_002859 [Actinomortierella wolfii]
MDENRRRLHLLIIKSKAPPTSLSDLEWTLVQATPLDDLPQLTKYDAGYWSCNVDAAGSITAGVGFERTSPVPYVIMRFDPAGVEDHEAIDPLGLGVEGDEKGPYLIMREMEPPPITSRRLLSSISCNPKSLGVHTRGPLVNITDDYHVLDSGPVTLGQVGQVGTSSLPVGAIIGIAIGVLAVLALICFIFIRWRRMALTSKPEDESIQKQPENDEEEMTMQGKAEMDKSSVENDKVAMEQDAESMAIGNQNDEGDQIGDKRESPSMQSRVLVLMNEPGRVERSHGNRNNGNFSTMDEWIPKPFDPRIYEQVHTPTTERVWTFDHVHIPADEQAVSTMTNPTETPR